ncbi:MAG: hypothetical protein RBR35_07210 [Salinivirgaceae bacterium]|nr:hypothetical protein [Salinivirgaceae bacterium]
MKSTKMEKFQEKGLKDLSALSLNESEMSGVKGGKPWWMVSLTFSLNVQGFFDG